MVLQGTLVRPLQGERSLSQGYWSKGCNSDKGAEGRLSGGVGAGAGASTHHLLPTGGAGGE